jgi:hypothetical protein
VADYETLHASLIPIHGVFGVVALVAGLVALSVSKRRPWHPWAGGAFLVAMAVAMAIAAPVIIAADNVFLVGVSALVIYHGAVAWRLARLKPPARLPTPIDRRIHVVFGVAFVAFALFGARMLVHGIALGAVPVVLSAISLHSVRHFSRFMAQTSFEPGAWLPEHIRGMAAAFIASVTAFSAATGPRLVPSVPPVFLWLVPILVLTAVFMRAGAGVRRRLAPRANERSP